ncbi:universal stress protein [Xanthomarina sp. F1114]|uniref:universal stress protein n=1 Tax=Xanthomarina sp. F1114 TaxID=2996019 RepID=UPI00225E4ED4|nr:universal stress protein [Xanthomarina sp. F1114]MCX7549037.1 universal stress protein [Xanthomarina sp. F1114]
MKRHHILIPTDFSDNAWTAALYALNLYANEPCTFYLSHAWTFLNTGARTHVPESYLKPLREAAKDKLESLKNLAEIESNGRDHEFETLFCMGSLMDSIELSIKEKEIDLVVMGTKGATGTQEFLFGSNTVAIINKMRLRPVLLVPSKATYVTPTSLVFPTDFNRFYGEELKSIKHIADLHKSKIEILHINKKEELNDTQNANMEMLDSYLEGYEHHFNWVTDKKKKERAITRFIKKNDINILTMINYEHSFVENLIKEPVIKKMGYHSIVPFLVIPRVD